jgi:glycosyltransferase involved in cell wall biosynthesis
VLNVAYPFAPVTADPVGGAEQVVAQLDRALHAAGHRSIVIAAAGSSVSGELLDLPPQADDSEIARRRVQRETRAAIESVLARHRVDVMHFHGNDFCEYLPTSGPPALVSLHLPLHWYAAAALRPLRTNVWLQPVSAHQARTAPRGVALLPPIENGVDAGRFPVLRKRGYALMLGRVCREKGFHDALDAAKLASVPLLLAGAVFPWPEHRQYFNTEVLPRLDASRRWIGALAGSRKRRLLAGARCLLIPSRAEETSSLVAMESLAAGTPVIAYRSGALVDIVEHGVTGFLVDDVTQMADAIELTQALDADACRQAARTRFPLARMLGAYLDLYRRIAAAPRARKELPRG